jgi:hypothetical protein
VPLCLVLKSAREPESRQAGVRIACDGGMRYAILALSVFTGACSAAPGAPLTDVTATNTETTGPYEVVRRIGEGKRFALQVDAMRPDRAQAIADNLVAQLLPYSPDEVVVEVRPHESVSGETTRIRWVRGADVPAAAVSRPTDGGAPADRIGDRPTGQSGTAH